MKLKGPVSLSAWRRQAKQRWPLKVGEELWLEAALDRLLMASLQLDRAALLLAWNRPLAPDELQRLESSWSRCLEGEPLPYVLEEKWFYGHRFHVGPGVLIPREESELLVEEAKHCLRAASGDPQPNHYFLEWGVGSGNLIASVATFGHEERGSWSFYGLERSKTALDYAQKNLSILPANRRIHLAEGDWWSEAWDPQWPASYHLILSNPPYLSESEWWEAPSLYAEPKEALVARENGLADLKQIMRRSKALLKPGGWLLLEHGAFQSEAVQREAWASGYSEIRTLNDLSEFPRVTKMRKKRL